MTRHAVELTVDCVVEVVMRRKTVRIYYQSSAGSYRYEGDARFALFRLWWVIFRRRFDRWWRGGGWAD